MKIFIPTILVVLFDQISKIWIKQTYYISESRNILGDFLRFSYIENPGMAFGIRVGGFNIIITILSALVVLYIISYLRNDSKEGKFSLLGLTLILGGAIGNLIDRIFMLTGQFNYIGVIDFIDIGIEMHRWYTFNIADSAVSVGIVLYMIQSIFFKEDSSAPNHVS